MAAEMASRSSDPAQLGVGMAPKLIYREAPGTTRTRSGPTVASETYPSEAFLMPGVGLPQAAAPDAPLLLRGPRRRGR